MKTCSKCLVVKPFAEFHKHKSSKDGYKPRCKTCRKIDFKEALIQGIVKRQNRFVSDSHRECSRCHLVKSNHDFTVTYGKYISQCKQCKRELSEIERRKIGQQKRLKALLTDNKKQCLWCGVLKPFSEYSKDFTGRAGLKPYCKKCSVKYVSQDKFRERLIAQRKRWKENNPERYKFLNRYHSQRRRAMYRNANTGLVSKEFLDDLYNQEICSYCCCKVAKSKRTADHVIPLNKNGLHHPDNLVMACKSCNSSKNDRTPDEWFADLSVERFQFR